MTTARVTDQTLQCNPWKTSNCDRLGRQGSKQQLKECHGETTGLEAPEWSRSHIPYACGQPSVFHRGVSWSNVKNIAWVNKCSVLRKVPSTYYLFQSATADKPPWYICSSLKPITSFCSLSYSESKNAWSNQLNSLSLVCISGTWRIQFQDGISVRI